MDLEVLDLEVLVGLEEVVAVDFARNMVAVKIMDRENVVVSRVINASKLLMGEGTGSNLYAARGPNQ